MQMISPSTVPGNGINKWTMASKSLVWVKSASSRLLNEMKLVFIFVSLQLMLLATSLNARRCYRTTSTSVAPGPSSKPTTSTTQSPTDGETETTLGPVNTSTPGPTDDDPTDATDEPSGETTDAPSEPSGKPTDAPSDPSGETSEAPLDPSGETTGSPLDPTEKPSNTTLDPTGTPTDAPSDPSGETSDAPSDPSGETTDASSDPNDSSGASTDTSPTTKPPPEIDCDAACQAHPGVHYLPNPYNCHQFIQCDGNLGYMQTCPSGLFWDSVSLTCDTVCK